MGPERTVEKWCREESNRRGALLLKWTGTLGAPDRILIRRMPLGYAEIIFVEFKAPGKKPTAIQAAVHRQLREMGCNVEIIDSREDFVALFG